MAMLSKTHTALCSCPMSIDLRQLRYFVATAEHGSANQAAVHLHMTQPSLSRQLHQLQRNLGIVLFSRDGGRLVLTRAGEQFLPHARDLLARAEQMRRAAQDIGRGHLDELHIAIPSTTLTDVLAPFIASLTPADPVPVLRELDPYGAVAALRAGADLAIVSHPPSTDLVFRPLAVLPVLAYVAAEDPWVGRASVDVAELVDRKLILLTERFRPRRLLDAALQNRQLTYGEVLECTNAQIALALAASGRGVAVVTDDPRFGLVGIPISTRNRVVTIELRAAWYAHHHGAAVIAELSERIARFCVDRYGPQVAPPTITR
jgi:DNA-binding transcriptional LysR family regulator